ncbi:MULTISPECIES: alpha/beta fold hydrolase [unclassified Microbacterium]|uniref:alpha/beta fold hydrolase n=1 Tax=unclassified Microbacterium TaxID=2609290 RepID=UPI0012F748D3|nr:alpha/beta hydrolase [Microbacterium sp. MAH-37]MVQ42999.1 alpha/beta fold hydrolase [Microbacterium sp. MAH-37]
MDIILVPGLWLDATSWDPVLHALKTAGHHPFAMTMPGVGAPASESSEIGMADWVDAVVTRIDEADEPVVLVGHSGGGNVVWGAADARPERVRRVVFVDTVPPPPGGSISEFPVVHGVVPFPGWDFFPDEDVFDLDAETRARTAPLAQSVPARVPTDEIVLTRESRHGVPITLLMGGLDQATFEAQVGGWGPYGEEYNAIADAEVVKIGSGHWPQFSVPERLSELLVEAVAR